MRRLYARLPRTNPPIGEALALNALSGDGGALEIGYVAGVIPEIEFAEIALKVLGRNPMIDTDDAALEDRKKLVLHRVGVPKAASDILLDRMVDGAVSGEFAAGLRVDV